MPINNAMKKALHALSYSSNIDISKTYKLKRKFKMIKTLAPLYRIFDKNIECNGRKVLVRLYRPKAQTKDHLILFFHGWGWVLENINTYNNVCRNLTKYTGYNG